MAHMPDPNEAIQRFLGQWSPLTRAEALHLALQSLRDRVEPDRVLACELAWEVHAKGYWSQVRNADGTTYPPRRTISGTCWGSPRGEPRISASRSGGC